eukprot:CAMPEP_0172330918 /NCGR_PEP_ID=MMETSP1058-20130122/61653_1 /TAXON_ID=83371 /ORGANISM="Detonula confervacea, Strain CCMP 353" /LENGTH=658 /DNA_ID=CAMNT_0013048155 /DNA_START=126 /DNA_END=2102 /DNA_ORIENTATION=-
MFKVQSIALTAALYGLLRAQTAFAAGCSPSYASNSNYEDGDWVSATTTTTTDIVYGASCTTGSTNCVNGYVTTGGVTTTATHNFQCVVPAFCSQAGFAPGIEYGKTAWAMMSATCSGTADAPQIAIPASWSEDGCPEQFSAGSDYDEDSLVHVKKSAYNMVYRCNKFPTSDWCSMAGYEPGSSQYWEQAWTELGSCTGTMSPTDSPSNVVLDDVGGCPDEFAASADYEEGDEVSNKGLVYQCKGWPQSQHCSQAGYTPGEEVGGVENWIHAWTVVGHCSGTIGPTSAPSHVQLTDMGGCPESWSAKSVEELYEEGDKVESNGLVFACKAWPFSGHCSQAGYEPLFNPATPDAWKDAWSLVGYCNGSIGPTAAPNFDVLATVGACPQEWVSGDQSAYAPDDKVSVTVSQLPLRKVVYKCKSWPSSNHCGQHAPNVFGGDLGWSLDGSCTGTTGPTSSPSFDSLGFISNPSGCPPEFSTGSSDYEAGDLVSTTVSLSPLRKVVYECRAWPNVGYCNQVGGSMDPGKTYGYLGWTLRGACEGTLAPTPAPQVYAGACTYIACTTASSCTPGAAAANTISGSTACSCGTGVTASSSCKQQTCVNTQINTYSSSATYVVGSISRRGTQKYVCRVAGWCNNSGYAPETTQYWTQAWSKSDTCPP